MKNKISVVTVSYNQGKFIENNIKSVIGQGYENFEHIVIDGGSTDNTVDILKKYEHLNWVSEPDDGQSHALNKGFKKAKGSIIAWINSDDKLEPDALKKISAFFEQYPKVNAVIGDLKLVDKDQKFIKKIKGFSYTYNKLAYQLNGVINQPATFFKREVFDQIGYIDENLHYCMDYDFFLRLSSLGEVKYIPEALAVFTVHEDAKTSMSHSRFFIESLKVLRKYNIPWLKSKAGKSAIYTLLTEPIRIFLYKIILRRKTKKF